MDKSTLSNYGWIIIVTLILAVMLALATPFGTYVGDGVVAVANSFVQSADNAMDEDNIDQMAQEWEGKLDYSAFEEEGNSLNNEGIIPEGGRYLTNATLDSYPYGSPELTDPCFNYADAIEYTAGQKFPSEVKNGDRYYYGNYVYVYNGLYGCCYEPTGEYAELDESIGGWAVSAQKYKGDYAGEILETVNGKPITSLRFCFYSSSISILPQIPETVTNLSYFTGDSGAMKYINSYFGSTDAIGDLSNYKIPNSVTNMGGTFSDCTSLTTAPIIPNSVTDMQYAFYGCTALTTVPTISNSVTNMEYAFSCCTNLTTVPAIPNSVTNMNGTFGDCTSLTTAPTIPNSVTKMHYTFNDCTSLTGTITINANPTSYINCFYLSSTGKPITLNGSSTMLQELANTNNDSYRTITIQ